MKTESQRPKGREGTAEGLNAAIEATNLAERVSSIAPAKAVFGSVNDLLTQIRVCFPPLCRGLLRFTRSQDSTVNEPDYAELGLSCADICRVLDQGTNGKKPGELSQSVHGATDQLSV